MITFFRKIRQNMIKENRVSKYTLYAIGEIILVVIGILIALQINNWNENNKAKKTEIYVLGEVLNNLNEDAVLVEDIILQRQKTKNAVNELRKFVSSEKTQIDSLQYYMTNLLTFERYYRINNAYEILKSKGLQLSNNSLTTKISRYYDYEQPKMHNSILDIEVSVLKIYNDPTSIIRFLRLMDKDKLMIVKNPDDPIFKQELSVFLIAFQDNNFGTLEKLLVFKDINKSLREQIAQELKELN